MQNIKTPDILSVRTAIADGFGRYAMVRRAEGHEMAGFWELPGGGVNPGEAALAAALREPREEAGIIAYPTSHLTLIDRRIIPDGKHAGKTYVALGCTAIARPPFTTLRTSNETDQVGWFTPAEIRQLPFVTPTSQLALNVLIETLVQAA